MLGGGEFIINGAERVVVSQLHRSPGVDFVMRTWKPSDRKLLSCRIIPERGSWIELNTSKKDTLSVRIDQSGKFSAMTLLRAMEPQVQHSMPTSSATFYETTKREDRRWPQRRRRSKARSRSMTSSIRPAAIGPARSSSKRGQKITKNAGRDDLHLAA